MWSTLGGQRWVVNNVWSILCGRYERWMYIHVYGTYAVRIVPHHCTTPTLFQHHSRLHSRLFPRLHSHTTLLNYISTLHSHTIPHPPTLPSTLLHHFHITRHTPFLLTIPPNYNTTQTPLQHHSNTPQYNIPTLHSQTTITKRGMYSIHCTMYTVHCTVVTDTNNRFDIDFFI